MYCVGVGQVEFAEGVFEGDGWVGRGREGFVEYHLAGEVGK
jgi:hypothetical protein